MEDAHTLDLTGRGVPVVHKSNVAIASYYLDAFIRARYGFDDRRAAEYFHALQSRLGRGVNDLVLVVVRKVKERSPNERYFLGVVSENSLAIDILGGTWAIPVHEYAICLGSGWPNVEVIHSFIQMDWANPIPILDPMSEEQHSAPSVDGTEYEFHFGPEVRAWLKKQKDFARHAAMLQWMTHCLFGRSVFGTAELEQDIKTRHDALRRESVEVARRADFLKSQLAERHGHGERSTHHGHALAEQASIQEGLRILERIAEELKVKLH